MGELFLKLLNMSITAGWLILAVLCIRLLFRKIPKWVTCLLWGVVAVRLIFPFSIESVFSLQPSAEPIKTSTIVEGDVVPFVPSIDSNLEIVKNTVNPILAETFAYQESESAAPLQVFAGIAGNVWLCGMAVLFLFAIVSMIRLRRCVREAVLFKENIYICDAVRSPFILGIIKPRIYLSSSLSEEEAEYIIAHERAHLKRKDHFWKPLGYLLLCIYWFHPLCWIAYMMLCRDIELACDEKVIKDMHFEDKKEYSRVLLSCATQRHLVLACPLAFGEVGVKERVKTVLDYKRPAFWITIAAIAVCILVAICFLTNPKKDIEDVTAERDNSIYENIVSGLGDREAYAFLDMNYKYMVLLTSDLIYDEGREKQAALGCDIYYPVNGKAEKLGSITSDGTAYPITFTEDGIFVASNHKTEQYAISEAGELYLKKGVYEQFDEAGNVRYTAVINGKEKELTELEYQQEEEYGRSQPVHFSYGAEDSVNEYLEPETVLELPELVTEEIHVEKSDVTHDGVADYIVTSMTYHAADMDEHTSLEEKIEQQVKYDIVSVKVYEGDSASDTYQEERLLWSHDYSSVHMGNGQVSIVKRNGQDYLLTSSLWCGQGLAAWEYEVFSLDAQGEKKVLENQELTFDVNDKQHPADYAAFQDAIKEYYADSILLVACDADMEQQFIRTQEMPYTMQDYYDKAFAKYDIEEP